MSAVDDHLEQARRNRSLAEELLAHPTAEETHVQWAVTAAFYCAVHCIQAHLLERNIDPISHAERAYWSGQPAAGFPTDVRNAYFWLKARSEKARYRLGIFAPGFVRRRVLDERLKRITDFVNL
jgi:hypothetical protein